MNETTFSQMYELVELVAKVLGLSIPIIVWVLTILFPEYKINARQLLKKRDKERISYYNNLLENETTQLNKDLLKLERDSLIFKEISGIKAKSEKQKSLTHFYLNTSTFSNWTVIRSVESYLIGEDDKLKTNYTKLDNIFIYGGMVSSFILSIILSICILSIISLPNRIIDGNLTITQAVLQCFGSAFATIFVFFYWWQCIPSIIAFRYRKQLPELAKSFNNSINSIHHELKSGSIDTQNNYKKEDSKIEEKVTLKKSNHIKL